MFCVTLAYRVSVSVSRRPYFKCKCKRKLKAFLFGQSVSVTINQSINESINIPLLKGVTTHNDWTEHHPHWHQRTSDIGGPPLSFLPLDRSLFPCIDSPPFHSPFLLPSVPYPLLPLNPTTGPGECCKLPLQRVRAEPDRQTLLVLFTLKLDGHGRARREAARRRKSECKINFRKTKFLSQ